MKYLIKISLLLIIGLRLTNVYGQQYIDNSVKYPLVVSTFYTVKYTSPQKFDDNTLFLLFVKSLDSVFNFEQQITVDGVKIRVKLYDSTIVFNDFRIDTISTARDFGGALSWGPQDKYNMVNPRADLQAIDRYCNIIQPKISYILSKYKINIDCDYYLANFLVSLTCPSCAVYNKKDYTKITDMDEVPDLKFSESGGMQSIIYSDVILSDSIKIKAGASIIKAENVPVQLLPFGLLSKLIIGRKDTVTKLLIRQDNKLITGFYRFHKDTAKEFEYKRINDSIGYVKINLFGTGGIADSIGKILASDSLKIKKLIIDLRECPGGSFLEALHFCDLFLDAGHLIGESYSAHSFGDPAKQYISDAYTVLPHSRIYLLTNNTTGGGAEITAGALKESGRGIIIGEATQGEGSLKRIQKLYFIDDFYITVCTSDFFTAKKYKLGVDRVLPDVYCQPKAGADNLLETALKMCR